MGYVEILRGLARQADEYADWERAAGYYEKLLELDDTNFLDSYFHARAVLFSGHTSEAAKLIADLPRIQVGESTILTLQAELEERLGNYQKAGELWGEALEAGASKYWSLLGQARAISKLGQIDEARKLMEQALAQPDCESTGRQFADSLDEANFNSSPGALVTMTAQRNPTLGNFTFDDLLSEMLYRLRNGEGIDQSETRIACAQELQEILAENLETHENRFSMTRLRDLFAIFYLSPTTRPIIRNASIVDFGSGSHNPLGLLFLFIMLGARQARAIDLEPMQNPSRAFRALAHSADVLRTDPARIVGDYQIFPQDVDRNLATFNLVGLRAGQEDGLDQSRLKFLRESAAHTSIETSSVDLVISNSFLEHVEDLESVVKEMARITVPGGLGIHNIDGIDHRSYGDPSIYPLEFLREPKSGMIEGTNRIRILEYPALFQRYGFSIVEIIPYGKMSIDNDTQQSFAKPWRDMPRDYLEITQGRMIVQRN